VLLNPGSESHVGPGRAWVEFARALAARGNQAVRVDFRGWGESPDDGRVPARLYDPRGVEDTVEIVRALEAAGHPRVVIVGLCASAWIALRAVLDHSLAGVIALNPQMYWEQGDTLEIDWVKVRAGREREIARIERGERWGLWNVLDALGYRPWGAAWLEDLKATGVPIHLVFTDGDDGLVFLRSRHRRRLGRVQRAGTVTVRELPGVDHPLHLAWRRPQVTAALAGIVADEL
jgi:pimeloyl-ACP methyl ester carboxylesterase